MGNHVVVHIVANAETHQAVEKVIADLKAVKTAAEESNASLSRGVRGALQVLGPLGTVLGSGLGFAAAIYGAQALTAAFAGVIRETTDTAMQLKRMSEQTGISVENLSILRYASMRTGVGFETLSRGFKHFATTIYEDQIGMKQAALGFNALGISQKAIAATGYDMWKVLALVQQAFSRLPDGVQKSAAATALFGRSSQVMIPILNDGAEGLAQMREAAIAAGAVWDDQDLSKMDALKQKTTDLAIAWEHLKRSFVEGTAPATAGAEDFLAKGLNWLSRPDLVGNSHAAAILTVMGGGSAPGYVALIPPPAIDNASSKTSALSPSRPSKVAPSIAPPPSPEEIARAQQLQERAVADRRRLAEQEAALRMAKIQSEQATQLQLLSSLHAQQLVSDRDYYQRRAALEDQAWSRQRSILEEQKTAIVAQMDQIERAHPADSRKKLQAQQELAQARQRELEIERQLLELDGRRVRANIQLAEQAARAARLAQEQRAQIAADLESAQGSTGKQKALDLQKLRAEDERRKLAAQGATQADLAQYDALERLREAKIQVSSIDQRRSDLERAVRLEQDKVTEDALSGAVSQEKAAKDMQTIHQREIAALRQLQAEYKALGIAGMQSAQSTEDAIANAMQRIHDEQKAATQDISAMSGEAEKIAHTIFDPLFAGAQRWRDTWRQIVQGLIGDIGQLAESQLFGFLFGDPQGRGGRGLNGTSFQGDTSIPFGAKGSASTGILGEILGHMHRQNAGKPLDAGQDGAPLSVPAHRETTPQHLLGMALSGIGHAGVRGAQGLAHLFHHPQTLTSNGNLGAGPGALPTAAAALANAANGMSGESGVQVVIHNHGQPVAAASASKSAGAMSQQVVNIVLKDISSNGSIGQAITGIAATLIGA